MYVIDTALEEQARQDLIARFATLVEQNGGAVDRIDEWGKRRLAYAINYKTEGYYVLMYITAPSALPRELERNLQISESVLRYLVIRFEGALPPKREALQPVQTPAHAAPIAPVSYTHLDVYKRQVHGGLELLDLGLLFGQLLVHRFYRGGAIGGAVPVSYTHLS